MNTYNRVLVSMIYYNSLLRDTLEYTLRRSNFDINHYNYKKNGVINEPLLNTPLKSFLDNNGDKSQKFREEITEVGNLLYGDNSTIIKVEGGKIEVDHNQNVTIFEKVIPLSESMTNVIRLHDKFVHDNNQVEEKVEKLVSAEEAFHRAVVLLTLGQEINYKFDEFNKFMREGHGEKTPSASFCENELQRLTSLFYFSKQNANCTDSNYIEALDSLEHLIEMMNGKRPLPTGKSFRDVSVEVSAKTNAFLIIAQDAWSQIYPVCVEEMVNENKRLKEEAEKAAAEEENKGA